MDYFEKAETKIKNEWFKDHIAELHGEEGNQVLYWHKKGTSRHYVKYIFSGRHLIVTGDIGDAIFWLTCPATIDNIKDFELNYLMGKLTAHSGKRWNFDYKKAQNELEEWYEEAKEDGIEDGFKEDFEWIYADLMRATTNWDEQIQFEMAVFSIYERYSPEIFDSEDASMVSDFGKRLPYNFIAYWVGLKMAIEQLKCVEKHE